MAEYINKNDLDIAFKDECRGDCGCCPYWNMDSYEYDCGLVHNFQTTNVVEMEKIDRAIEEIEDLDPITERVGQQVKQDILAILKKI